MGKHKMVKVNLDNSPIISRPKDFQLFTVGNPKTKKGESLGFLTLVLHLSPHKDNDFKISLCEFATKECIALCLNDSGRSAMLGKNGTIRKARRRKANEFLTDKRGFLEKIVREIRYYQNRAKKKGLTLVVRLNGTSDIQWSQVKYLDGRNIFEILAGLQFYDYTKNPEIARDSLGLKNYDITFSWSGKNEKECYDAIGLGLNIAVAFTGSKKDPLPDTFLGLPVLNADINDLRFLDAKRHVAGLKVKGNRQRKVKKSSFLVTIERKNAA
jgi:hypothetical protein